MSKEAKDLITKLLQVDPEKRLSIEEALNHEWIKKKYMSDQQLDYVT